MADPYAQFLAVPEQGGATSSDPYSAFMAVPIEGGRDWTVHKDWKSAKAEIDALPEGERDSARKEWARQTVTKEREGGGIMQRADDFVRRLARGIPGGSWADEGNAAIASGLGIADYDQQLAYERAKDQIGDDTSTKLGTLPVIGDVHTSGLTKLAGGILSAPVTPMVRAAQGAAMLPTIANMTATGAVYGGVQGSGEGETLGDRAVNTGKGVLIGGGTGAIAAPLARGVGNAVEWAGNKWKGLPPELAGLDKGSVQRVGRAATDDDLLANYPRLSQELGQEGMLMDMGPNMRGQASAIANQPGAGQRTIRTALETRQDGAGPRIQADINAAFGPEQNLVQLETATVNAANRAAGPHFDDFYNRTIPANPQLDNIMGRIPDRVVNRAQEIARTEGQNLIEMVPPAPGQPPVERITPRGWDYYKRAIQDLIDKEEPTSQFGRALTELDNQLRAAVDTAVNPANPAAGPWAQARAIAGTGKQFAQGIDDGSGVFSRPKTHNPDQVADDIATGGPVYETGYRAGARGDLANMMNDAGTQFGPAGDKAARKGLWSTNAERKVRQLATQPRSADRLLQRRDAESTFGETQNAVTGNSATSARLQAQKEFPNPVENDGSGAKISDTTVTGMLAGVGRKALNAMTLGAHNEKLRVMAENAARILSATGIQRAIYFRGLERHLTTQGVSAAQAARVSRAVESLMLSSVPSATGAATSPPK